MKRNLSYEGGLSLFLLSVLSAGCPISHPGTDGGDTGTPTDGADTAVGDTGVCPAITFQSPSGTRTLGPADDVDGSCGNGFQTNVTVATNAANGTRLDLLVGSSVVSTATVAGPSVTFQNVMLNSMGTQQLSVRVTGTTAACGTPVSVAVECGTPTCSIVQPMNSMLNLSNSVAGSMTFATDFVVQTNVEANQMVQLQVTSPGTASHTLMATSNGSMARFAAVALTPDGEHHVLANCTNRAGVTGHSAEQIYTVDSVPPTLMATQPMNGTVIPFDADVDTTLAGRQFRVCGRSDAMGQRLCASRAGDMPATTGCADVTDTTMDTCVEVTCPDGAASFPVTLTVSDTAGNQTTATIGSVACASTAPSVRIVDPLAYDPATASTVLNAARDTDTTRAGLQYNVRVCTDSTSGMMQLLANGNPIGTAVAVAAAAAGDCPTGFAGVARFANASIPESAPARSASTDPAPIAPVLTAQITAPAGAGTSPGVTLYVDSLAPSLRINLPACPATGPLAPGSSGSAVVDFSVIADTLPVTLTYQAMGGMAMTLTQNTYTIPSTQVVQFTGVSLAPGNWTVSATSTDPAANVGSSINCNYLVGNPPVITFVNPINGQAFGSTGDGDAATAGYQGATLTLHTEGVPAGMNISLSINGGTAITAAVNASGDVTFGPLTLPEGDSITLHATTPDIAGRGVGSTTISVIVDTQGPGAVGAPVSLARSRRGGTFGFTFTQASDPGTPARAVSAYEVRTSTTGPVTSANFASATASTVMVATGAPGAAGTFDLSGYSLPTTLYVGIRARDAAGNTGVVTSFPVATLDVLTTTLPSTLTSFGQVVAGGYDVNGDGIHDLVVGGVGEARIYFGSSSGISATSYTRLTGGASFGVAVASIGDFNNDGVGDVAVGDDSANSGAGAVYIFFGRNGTARSWPATSGSVAAATEADVTIASIAPEDVAGALGHSLARVDFDGDGRSDLAIGARFSNAGSVSRAGAVFVIRGTATAPTPVLTLPVAAAALVRGDATHLRFGVSLANGGTLTGGDRRDDLLVGGFSSTATGNIISNLWVFGGRDPSGTTVTVLPTDSTVVQINATGPAHNESIGTAGDFDGDGLQDLLVGSTNYSSLRIFFGLATGSLDLANPSSLDLTGGLGVAPALNGGAPAMSRTLLNGGRMSAPTDLISGTATFSATSEPVVAAFSGRAKALWSGVGVGVADYRFQTPRQAGSPTSIPLINTSWIGDINNDGFQDLAAGQPENGPSTGAGIYAGSVHVLY